MHTVALLIAGFITLMLAGPALLRGGIVRAWFSAAASIIPCWILWMAYPDRPSWYLLPAFILLTVALLKAAAILKSLLENTPRALNNVPSGAEPHWAST